MTPFPPRQHGDDDSRAFGGLAHIRAVAISLPVHVGRVERLPPPLDVVKLSRAFGSGALSLSRMARITAASNFQRLDHLGCNRSDRAHIHALPSAVRRFTSDHARKEFSGVRTAFRGRRNVFCG